MEHTIGPEPDLGHDAPRSDEGPRRDASDPVVAGLVRRTEEILSSQPEVPDEEARAFEKEVVRECRYLLRLLGARRRSCGELRAKLRAREVAPAVAREAMARTDRAGLLDDRAFARDWVEQRRALRSLSDEALRRELQAKDVDEDCIAAALALGQDEEEDRARALVRDRLRRDTTALRADRDGSARGRVARRLDALLRRKGYDGALALRVISTEIRALTGR